MLSRLGCLARHGTRLPALVLTRPTLVTRRIHTLPALPYPLEAGLLPVFTPKQLNLHYKKHHLAVVQNSNRLIHGTKYEHMDTEIIMKLAAGDASGAAILNQCAEVWNHDFFWKCMTPGGSPPSKNLEHHLAVHFQSFEEFQRRFKMHAMSLFGSGWVWLVLRDRQLEILTTVQGGCPLLHRDVHPLLGLDVWEHAYYADYENRRGDYVDNWLKVVDWKGVDERFNKALEDDQW
eukprot:TRINITY_DN1617_c0_g1_i1.p1 TRINITY_DN1617_c0_g1~~TRINITY_DN1617_c0_g1_i1.p1  ORF type:complete len:234 (+),score=26.00 TRINITY_DN1617_c0_g1_i1:45-746(+)